MGHGILAVQTEALEGADADFNRWYDEVHVPEILSTPGFDECRRYRVLHSPAAPTGHATQWARYLAIYEIASPDVVGAHAALMQRVRAGELTAGASIAATPYRSQLFEQIAGRA